MVEHDPTDAPVHTRDSDCDVDPCSSCCRVCGVLHGEPCEECGGAGYHVPGCSDPDAFWAPTEKKPAALVTTERVPMRLRFDGSDAIVHASSGAVLMTCALAATIPPGDHDGAVVYAETQSGAPAGMVWCHASIEVGAVRFVAGAPDLVPARVRS
jgi:hypothetical protein